MIIDVFLPLSLIFIMFTLGIGLTYKDFTNLIKNPRAFLVGIINQMILLPILAFFIILSFGITKGLAVGIMLLASCPGGVTSNIITKLANGDTALSISYTAINSLLTIFTLPIITILSMMYFIGTEAPPLNVLSLGLTMFFITAMPVGLGMFVSKKNKYFAQNFEPVAIKISTLLFMVIIIGALVSEWRTFINNIFQIGPAIFLLIFIMLILGYKSSIWFKLNHQQSITVAIESGIQNGTVGITIGNIIMNSETGLSILSIPSGVYSILMYFICLPFVFWLVKQINK